MHSPMKLKPITFVDSDFPKEAINVETTFNFIFLILSKIEIKPTDIFVNLLKPVLARAIAQCIFPL